MLENIKIYIMITLIVGGIFGLCQTLNTMENDMIEGYNNCMENLGNEKECSRLHPYDDVRRF